VACLLFSLGLASSAASQPDTYELPARFLRGIEQIRADVARLEDKLARDVVILGHIERLEAAFERVMYSQPPLAPSSQTIRDGLATVRKVRAQAEADPPLNPFFRQDLVSLEQLLAKAETEPSAVDWKRVSDQLRLVVSDGKMVYEIDRARLGNLKEALREEIAALEDLVSTAETALEENVWEETDRSARMPLR